MYMYRASIIVRTIMKAFSLNSYSVRTDSLWQQIATVDCGALPPSHRLLEIFAAYSLSSSGGFSEILDLTNPSCSSIPPPYVQK
jgi:hypothetical protein